MAVGEAGRVNGVKELIKTATALGSTTIDLSRKNLTEIPTEVFELQQLEFLYVEGNYLTTIPDDLFDKLPNLKWLDLRNNHLTEFPATIGSHKAIRNLLLEGNDIKRLPLELGFAKLSGLNLASNPLDLPPSNVIEKGTQEVLKFLREKYASKMELAEKEPGIGEKLNSRSSSEEDLFYSNDSQIAIALPAEEKAPTEDNIIRIERVRLPPIFQAAATRPRNRTVDDHDSILRGQKSTQFEPKPKPSIQVSEPEMASKSSKRHEAPRRVHSPPKNRTLSPEEKTFRGQTHSKKIKQYSDTDLRGISDFTEEDRKEDKAPRLRRTRRSRGQSPTKTVIHSNKSKEQQVSMALSYDIEIPHDSSSDDNKLQDRFQKPQEITVKANDVKVKVEHENTTKLPPGNPLSLNLKEGDFVAIKVPPKLYIRGQPCLGMITTMADSLGLLTVHYYTGTYEGYWRPMMSRTSPYLRKVPLTDIICKFTLSSDGRMSPITRAKVKKKVDGEEQKPIGQ